MLTVAVLEAQNKKLREENDELRETVRQLRANEREDVLPRWMPPLSGTEAEVMRLLWTRSDGVHSDSIHAALYAGKRRSNAIVRQWIHRLRQKLIGTPVAIASDGRGRYRLEREIAR